jgi:hypothetical protein
VIEDLLTLTERAKMRALNLELDALKHRAYPARRETEKRLANIAHELDLLEELQNVRANVRITSLIYARARLNEATVSSDAAMHLFEEALLNFDDDEYDGFEAAFKKSHRLDLIERQSDEAGAIYNNALLKLGWEISEAQKAGVICS